MKPTQFICTCSAVILVHMHALNKSSSIRPHFSLPCAGQETLAPCHIDKWSVLQVLAHATKTTSKAPVHTCLSLDPLLQCQC